MSRTSVATGQHMALTAGRVDGLTRSEPAREWAPKRIKLGRRVFSDQRSRASIVGGVP